MKTKLQEFFTVWFFMLLANQILIFGGCFAPYCLLSALPHTGVLSFLLIYFLNKSKDTKEKDTPSSDFSKKRKKRRKINVEAKEEHKHTATPKYKKSDDPLKSMGDKYERHIGLKFEEKGDLVIYNGFIKGYKDKGIDIISISQDLKVINLIQCKNWQRKPMTLEDIKTIFYKIDRYKLDFYNITSYKINTHLKHKKDEQQIRDIISNIKRDSKNYSIRKTLYLSSDKVVDINIGKHLTMLNKNIYKYEDMKIVVENCK